MEKAATSSLREKLTIDFEQLPGYAEYLLHHEVEALSQELDTLYEAVDLPLLRFFQSMESGQRLALVTSSTREMLTLVAANNAAEYLERTIRNWLTNQSPLFLREQVHAHDITLVTFIRTKVFRKFIPRYTNDLELWTALVEELDRFKVVLDSELFAAYMDLQKQEINKINEALMMREQQLLEAQEIGQVGSFEWDLQGNRSSYTPQTFKIFEMDRPSNFLEFLNDVHPEEQEKVRKAVEKAFVDGDYECEYKYVRNNKEKIILSRGRVLFNDGKPARMIGTITDVTERHQIVKKLQESERLHNQAQAITHIGNWSWMIQEGAISWSDEMYRIYGLEPQSETITFDRFISFIHPADRENRIVEIQKSLQTLEVEEYHFKINAATGHRKTLRGKGEVVTDKNGKPVIMLGTCQDVTGEFMLTQQLREREKYLEELNQSLETANQELRRSNEELESFNFIASHDLQEPLRKIQVYSNRILENGYEHLSPALQDYFARINKASGRMQKLIEDFLSFSQTFKANQPPETIDLNKIMEEILAELSTRIEEKNGHIQVSSLPAIYAVPFQIKQLLINLVSNSLKYTRDGVGPEIMITGVIAAGAEVIAMEGNVNQARRYAKISVKDNGIGFESRYKTKIFELFQRLHNRNEYSGTGIGLALCKKIVQNLNGFITADSEPGKGSTFTFYVPMPDEDQLRR